MKRKRKDNNIRKEENKNVEFSCIKCTWNKLVKNNYLKTGIEEIVIYINKINISQ
jgi:hypothetical protein